ncbi:MAG TPA: hypothetical protein VH639_26290 [Bryobacteraceae bacterium]
MTKELRVPLAELRHLSIECPNCQTTLTFDLDKSPTFKTPHECSVCHADWEPNSFVATFHSAYQDLRNSATRISFRIRAGE